MRYYIIAGERSGDLHGGNLVKSLRKLDPDAILRGYGGEYMQKAGVELAVHYKEMAFMGLTELLFKLRKFIQHIRQCKEDIDRFKPDVIILIDYGGFNRRIAKYGTKTGVKVFYYIPPKVWAWYQVRAKEIKANVDRLFVILPFEKEFYKKFDWEVDYVGNPVLDAVRAHVSDDSFLKVHNIGSDKPLVALLPGSRKNELTEIIPLMAGVVRQREHYHFVVAAIDHLDQKLYDPLKGFPNVTFVFDRTYDILEKARAAIVTSGTATLETALFNVPQIVVYKADPVSFFLAKLMVKVPFISLVNLIAAREVVREMIQAKANEKDVSAELDRIVQNGRRAEILSGYKEMVEKLDTGGSSASENTAHLMINYLKEE